MGCPIRKFMDHGSFSAPHDLSQSITSFIASCCLGIHQTPLLRLIRSRKSRAAAFCVRRPAATRVSLGGTFQIRKSYVSRPPASCKGRTGIG